jgi:exodeoxyribonuclease VII large subunit
MDSDSIDSISDICTVAGKKIKEKSKSSEDIKESYNVSEINNLIKNKLCDMFSENITLVGEISDLKLSGAHLYLSLKDTSSQIRAICFGFSKYNKINDYHNGDNIEVKGRIDCYVKGGSYNFVILKMKKLGIGDFQQEYDELKNKYSKLGYFDEKRKKKLPKTINTVAILTSTTGAALQDILYVLNKNNYTGKVIVKNCIVQGTQCPQSISSGLEYLANMKNENIDAIIISRGGGSLEDLIGYSHSKAIEAIYKCPIFTISAVGHEVDTMLSDLVADLRTPTPSVAGEFISNYQNKYLDIYKENERFFEEVIMEKIRQSIKYFELQIDLLSNKISNLDPREKINKQSILINDFNTFFDTVLQNTINNYGNRINTLSNTLQKYDINSVLKSGFVILTDNDIICDTVKDIKVGQKLKLKFKDGEATISIDSITYEK